MTFFYSSCSHIDAAMRLNFGKVIRFVSLISMRTMIIFSVFLFDTPITSVSFSAKFYSCAIGIVFILTYLFILPIIC